MIGKRLGNRYELESRVGSGGMAVVYLAKDLILDRYVAVKVLNDSLSNDENFVDRFRREARAAASLSHPNVVNIYDVGEDNSTHYIVMEYVDGKTLKERIKVEGALPVAEAVQIGEQIADALDHAHENGIVHRDIKSHNIMIGARGRVKVADFGIARATSAQTITHTGSVMGSVHYFSPEQARGGYIGEKSDIYSLGVVLYEMITGELPFSGDSPIAVALKHLQDEPQEPVDRRPGLPQSVDNIIRRAMAKDPLHRYNSARELQKDLSTALNPVRLNEPRWEPEDPDGEETMVIPAVRPADLANGQGIETAADSETGLDNTDDVPDGEGGNGSPLRQTLSRLEREGRQVKGGGGGVSRWKKAGFTILTVLLIVVLSGFGLNAVWSFMSKDAIQVPKVVGMSLEEATAELEDNDLNYEVVEQTHESAEGTVFRQSPEPTQSVKEGFTVTLYVSEGGNHVSIPNMINTPEDEAKQALYDLGFTPDDIQVEHVDDEDYASGHVVKHEPQSGETIAVGEKITLYVRPEENLVEVPDLSGEYQSTAEEKLRELGFKVYRNGEEGAIYDREADVPLYKVFGSTPAPGTMHPKGDVVRLHVSLNKSYRGGNYENSSGAKNDHDDSGDDEEDDGAVREKGKKGRGERR